jgi:uncharacterized membrane protein
VSDHLEQWLNLTVRWLHVIVGIAWIGTSFYFNWLNSRIRAPDTPEEGVSGELWSVHGGGFYRVVKYDVAPARLPRTLHWFMWEAYATWITGFGLLVLVYYFGAKAYLVRPEAGLSAGAAIAVGIGTLFAGWLVYDGLCRALAARPAALSIVGFALAAAAAYGLTLVFSSRGAYIHVGAMLGTIMAANVFRVIIPSQQEMVAAMAAGRAPDPARGAHAALRSLHNNYLTLPVLFIMISNHYPVTYGHRYNWAILAGIAVLGAATRHAFNLRNQGRSKPWLLPVAAAGMLALALVSAPRPRDDGAATVDDAEAHAIIERRCVPCHAETPTQPGFPAAPLGVRLDTMDDILRHADRIAAVAVHTETMPLGNLTGMTDEERSAVGRWLRETVRSKE